MTLVQQVTDQAAMAGAMPMLIEAARIDSFDFSSPFLQVSLQLVIEESKALPPSALSFLKVFSPELWYALLGTIFAVALGSYILGRLSPRTPKLEKIELPNNSLWNSFSAILGGEWETPKS